MGSKISTFVKDAFFSILLTSSGTFILFPFLSSIISSTLELPTGIPFTLRKVYAIAPPIRIASTFSIRLSMTLILSETFAPPIMATKGLLGSLTARPRYSISFLRRYPAAHLSINFVTPTIEACAL